MSQSMQSHVRWFVLLHEIYHRLGGLDKTVIFHCSGGREVQDRGVGRSRVWWDPLPGLQTVASLSPDMTESRERGSKLSCVSLIVRVLILFWKAPPSTLNWLSKTPPSDVITVGIGLPHKNYGGLTNVQSIASSTWGRGTAWGQVSLGEDYG